MAGDPGPTLGQGFYNEIINPAVVNYGIRNFQVLNELNIEYEGCGGKTRQQIGGDMYNIAYQIKTLAKRDNIGPVYLGFPGPGGAAADPASQAWKDYWDGYKYYLTLLVTDQGPAYNWLAVHCYETTPSPLDGRMRGQYLDLVGRITNYPMRWTEYGIPLDPNYCSPLPCNDLNAFLLRADGCRDAIRSFKNWVETQGYSADVYSVFFYLAYNSDPQSQANQDTKFELVRDNDNLQPAVDLASAF